MARTEWATRRYGEVLQRLEEEYGRRPERVPPYRNLLELAGNSVRLGFGHGQIANQRGVKGFPKATTETFYLEVPGPAQGGDLIVTVLGEAELVFVAADFERVSGSAIDGRYLPNFFRDRRDGRYWARVANHDVNYPLDDFVGAWPSSNATPRIEASPVPEDPGETTRRAVSPDDLFRNFKPQTSGDYLARVKGQVLVSPAVTSVW
jgi:hypothetical protein